jgi:hypothetical protein
MAEVADAVEFLLVNAGTKSKTTYDGRVLAA